MDFHGGLMGFNPSFAGRLVSVCYNIELEVVNYVN